MLLLMPVVSRDKCKAPVCQTASVISKEGTYDLAPMPLKNSHCCMVLVKFIVSHHVTVCSLLTPILEINEAQPIVGLTFLPSLRLTESIFSYSNMVELNHHSFKFLELNRLQLIQTTCSY